MGAFLGDPILLATVLGTNLPFISMAAVLLFTAPNPALSSKISVAAIAAGAVCSIFLLAVLHGGSPVVYRTLWFNSGNLDISFGYYLDSLSLLMLAIVGVIACLVQIYSLGYMAGDPGYSRYFAFQSLFAWAMMNMVVAGSLIQLFIFWEMVGLASYFLIGFYYEKWSASQAGKKAFVMNRVGDVGFFLGLIWLLIGFGSLGIPELNHAADANALPQGLLTVSALLIFCGVVGKSAQFPLLTWLPDAMEGPTPVSALLHSATMVAAGVYMFGRIFPFFAASPDAMAVALAIGTVTMLLSSTMAMVTYDLKQVWAYSTVSQLGMMVMALAAGGYFAGVFHLTTHAGFKALLFLCSGIFIHQFHTNDMRIIGKQGGRRLVIPMACIAVGALALSGVFPFSGFFSKEAVLAVLAAQPSRIWLAAGLLGAVMTAYYSFRLIFHILLPRGGIEEKRHDAHAHRYHEHEGERRGYIFWAMAIPVIVLAGVTLALGFFEHPIEHFLVNSNTVQPALHPAHGTGAQVDGGGAPLTIMGISAGLFGILLAWFEYGRKGADRKGFLSYFPAIWKLFDSRWFLDAFYRRSLDLFVYGGLTNLFTRNDRRVIDGGIDGICFFTESGGRLFSFLQSGMLQYNLLLMVLAVGGAVLYLLM
ncbi:MAG TPA: NADH-quinone oxidoreductase subunit L [Syntrophobacteraceae bacterium]|nr:NADH-quinone oxidoreductase subunit L [Syntrophobacteraceae bacterium]